MSKIQSRSTQINNLITTTFYEIRSDIIDYVFQITPFWDTMVQKGRIRQKLPKGTHFEVPIRYAKQDQNAKWYSRGGKFGRSEKESLTRLKYEAQMLGTAIPRFFSDDVANVGKAQLQDYINEIVENTKMSLADKLAYSVLVQDADANSIDALPTIITETPTSGTLGGATRSDFTALQNLTKDFSGLTTGSNLLDEMETMHNKSTLYVQGKAEPDVYLTTREVFQDYVRIARAMGMFDFSGSQRHVDLGMSTAAFKHAEVMWDPNVASGSMYALNTSTFEFLYNPNVWFEMTDWKYDVDGLDAVAQIISQCAFICTFPRKNGVIYDITTTSS